MENFNLEEIDKTFTTYKKGQMFDGVVIAKRSDGLIFNIGGKNDAFIDRNDFENFDEVKIGERFRVVITNQKNSEGLIEASQQLAKELTLGTQTAEKLRLGSKFSFVATSIDHGIKSKMGEYEIFVPMTEISNKYIHDPKLLIGKHFEAVVTEYDKEEKRIIASVKLLQEQMKEQTETMFWNSIFVNKIVLGRVKKIQPYGVFVSVDGVDCFCHISNLSYDKIKDPSEVVSEGEELKFKVLEINRENKNVVLGLKQLQESPSDKAIKEIIVGNNYKGEVVKILAFGAIVKLDNGVCGLLHVSNATEKNDKNIYEIVKLGDKIDVKVLSIDLENKKVAFSLNSKI